MRVRTAQTQDGPVSIYQESDAWNLDWMRRIICNYWQD